MISNLGYNLQKLAHVRNDRAAAAEKRLLEGEGMYSPTADEANPVSPTTAEQSPPPPDRKKKKPNYTKQGVWQVLDCCV